MTDLASALDSAIGALNEVRRAYVFDEEAHPRDTSGRFATKDGGSSTTAAEWSDGTREASPLPHAEARARYSTDAEARVRLQAAFPNAEIARTDGWRDVHSAMTAWMHEDGSGIEPGTPEWDEEMERAERAADRVVAVYDGLEQMAAQFPEAAERITKIDMAPGWLNGTDADAVTMLGPGRVDMVFSIDRLVDRDDHTNFNIGAQEAVAQDDLRYWSFGVAVHEWGHVLDGYAAAVEHGAEFTDDDYFRHNMGSGSGDPLIAAWDAPQYFDDHFDNAAGNLSTYAMTEPAEYAAEAFAASRLDPTDLDDDARDIVEWLEDRAHQPVGASLRELVAASITPDGTPSITFVDVLNGDCIPVRYALGLLGQRPNTAAIAARRAFTFDESLHPRDERGRFGEKDDVGDQSPGLQVRDFAGETGNRDHLTREETGMIPTAAIADLVGAAGEQPGQRGARRYDDESWQRLVDNIRDNGINDPIFITVDHGEAPKISEGNARRDAAVELGMPSVPVEIRYFGNAQEEGSVVDRARAAAIAGPAEIIREIPDKFVTDTRTRDADGWSDTDEGDGRPFVEGSTGRHPREDERVRRAYAEDQERDFHGRWMNEPGRGDDAPKADEKPGKTPDAKKQDRPPGTLTKKGVVCGDGSVVKIGDKVAVEIERGLSFDRFKSTGYGKAVSINDVGGIGVKFDDGSRRYFPPEDVSTGPTKIGKIDEGKVDSVLFGDKEYTDEDFDALLELAPQIFHEGDKSEHGLDLGKGDIEHLAKAFGASTSRFQAAFDESAHPRDSVGRFSAGFGTTFFERTVSDSDEAAMRRRLTAWAADDPKGTMYSAMNHDELAQARTSGLFGTPARGLWVSNNAGTEYLRGDHDVMVALRVEPGEFKAGGHGGDFNVAQIPVDRIVDVLDTRQAALRAYVEFIESEHPRGEHGRFAFKDATDIAEAEPGMPVDDAVKRMVMGGSGGEMAYAALFASQGMTEPEWRAREGNAVWVTQDWRAAQTLMAAIPDAPREPVLYRGIIDLAGDKRGDVPLEVGRTYTEPLASWSTEPELADDFRSGKYASVSSRPTSAVRVMVENAPAINAPLVDPRERITGGTYRVTNVEPAGMVDIESAWNPSFVGKPGPWYPDTERDGKAYYTGVPSYDVTVEWQPTQHAALSRFARRGYTAENFDESKVVRNRGRFARQDDGAEPDLPIAPDSRASADLVAKPLREISRGLDLTPEFHTSLDGPWGYNSTATTRRLDGAVADAEQILRDRYGVEQADRIHDVFRMWSVGAPKWLTGNEGSGGPRGGIGKGHLVNHEDVLEARSLIANATSDDTLYRGAPTRGAATWKPGEEHDLPHESSWSRNPDVASLFERIRRDGSEAKTTVMMTMAPGARGLDISMLGQPEYAWQAETVVAPQRVRVVSSERDGNIVRLNLEAVA